MCPSLIMYLHAVLLLFLSWLLLLLPQPTVVVAKNITDNIAKVTYESFFVTKQPGCPLECGNIRVRYPFGIGVDCSLDSYFEINCTSDSEPFLERLKVLSISPTQVRTRNFVASRCYNETGNVISDFLAWVRLLSAWPYTISDTANKFMVFSCDDFGQLLGSSTQAGYLARECGSLCSNSVDMSDLNCPGIRSCQINIPKGLKSYNVSFKSFEKRSQV
ncbi:wall-associated receptor kinase 2-like [Rhododendron vialii]|uniref:wall-associated receptor kinase 2-like n=1 Tax=Rhododendron vialii TaxID=182163 RepID=UPI00265F3268|nr:wall-associated receptor kinase 2-like [Rhododendron vialii]